MKFGLGRERSWCGENSWDGSRVGRVTNLDEVDGLWLSNINRKLGF